MTNLFVVLFTWLGMIDGMFLIKFSTHPTKLQDAVEGYLREIGPLLNLLYHINIKRESPSTITLL
jgi:hypothetical protein